jgi:MerR family transcriptional regulator, light-induced transcriptional regulator
MNAFTIKDLENLSGVKAHTIRIWEQRYSFLKPNRTATNIRYYTCEELKAVLKIALLNKYGFKISHIDRMCAAELHEKVISLSHEGAQQERILNEMLHYMVDMDVLQFEQLLNEQIAAKGIDRVITQLIFPFLNKIGVLWITSHIHPAQEHLVSNIIRQKLMVGIESLPMPEPPSRNVLLFLPEGEHHELGLLYLYYLLKSRGVTVIYLGANVPLSDVQFVALLKQPDFLFTHLTCIAENFDLSRYLQQAHKTLPSMKLVVSGNLAQSYNRKAPANIELKKSIGQVLEFVENL